MEDLIHKYFDKMEDLEGKLSDEVDTLVSKIDIKSIMVDPLTELMDIVSLLSARLEESFHKEAFNAGKKLAKDIQ